ncbi:MAG: FKBP-type peptidyl-prolyl cis-trans isomerase [Cytophagaceae bacterium]|nr:FKBP-type peptidyl-prolyl cis-trans isomerase [Gemmatimonadaceae bacterium]
MFPRLLLAAFVLAACSPNDSNAPVQPETTLETQVWSSSLNINLSAMTKLPSGVYILDQVVGAGATLTGSPTVRVYYTGWLANGTRFDGNVGNASPLSFSLGGLIPGWQLGMQGMKVGGKRKLVIPSSLGYGTVANGPIPANANLVFDIELVGIN